MTKKERRNELLKEEQAAMRDAEPALAKQIDDQQVDEATMDAVLAEVGADADAVLPAEAAAIHTDTDAAREASGDDDRKKRAKPAKTRRVTKRATKRSLKYQAAAALLDRSIAVPLTEAIEQVKRTSYSKFDGTVELHARLIVKKKGETESVRGLVTLPGGAPKSVNAVVLTEALIDEIATSKRANAELYLATPMLMPKVAKIAKILGPQGKMPNPKTGTVTTDPDSVLAEIQSGRIEYRADSYSIVHAGVGKVSWPAEQLTKNAQALAAAIGVSRLRSVHLSATMGPSSLVDLKSIGV